MKVTKTLKAKVFGIVLLSLWIAIDLVAQDPVFSQYDNNAAYINPAKISRFIKKTATINQRFQSALDTKYNTSQFTFIFPVFQMQNFVQKNQVNHKGGLGFSFSNDVTDMAFRTTTGNINFAYNWNIDPKLEHQVSFGLSMGFLKLAVDLDNYSWGEQYGADGFDPNFVPWSIPDEDRATVFDTGFGVYWTFRNTKLTLKGIKNIDAGISFNHLNSPNISVINNNEAPLPILIKLHSSLFYSINEKYFTGARLFYLQQQKNNRVNIGGVFGVNLEKSGDYIASSGKSTLGFITKEIYLDLWVSTNNTFGFATNFDFTNYRLGFSYEPNYSTFSVINKVGSAYELFLHITIPDKTK